MSNENVLLRDAADLLRRGSHAEAARLLQTLLKRQPRNPDALQLLGLAQKHLGQFDEAQRSMMASLALNQAQPHVLNNLGGLFLRRGQHHNARQCFQKALEFDPANKEALRNLALALRGLGNLKDAEQAARKAVALDANFAAARVTLGQILLESGESAAAADELKRATSSAPKSPEAWRTLGAALRTSGEVQESEEALKRAVALQPNSADSHAFLGSVYQAMGDRQRARQAFERAVALEPEHEQAHFALNQLLWTTGETTGFLESYERAESARPTSSKIRCAHAHTLMLLDRYADAEVVLREAAARDPNNVRVMALLGDVLSRLGQHDEATGLLGAASSHSANGEIAIGYARALLRAGDFAQAGAHLATCDPERLHARDLDQEHTALSYIAARFSDGERAAELFDYARLVRAWEIPTPKGFASVAEFNAALKERLTQLHTTEQAPLEQTLRGGTQTYGRLFNNADPLIQALRVSCETLIQRYAAELPQIDNHPIGRFRPSEARFAGSWSVRLRDGGFHKNHFHGRGWLSSAYYVSLPPEIGGGDRNRAGWLKFGQPHALPGADEAPEFWIKPEEGLLALFPSFMWHGTEAFASQEARITVAFDTQSREPTPGQLGSI
ncbi:MAG TPA: tetratricopeptide repeat protein [Vitreimonas sp.]|nr:tetratricopeptide repeat protein [Vitreimonas sp.]